ncbi:MAG: MarR family transcriptional regulator [Clostridiales bacterium]|nr:MarR family transcriptional regulator [Clostridiales bacterium]
MKTDNTISRISRIRDLANQVIVKELELRGHVGLVPSHGNILSALLYHGEMTKTEISSGIKKERSTVTTLLKKLENLGYIVSRVNEEDARSTIVSLSEKGILMKDDFIEISEKIYDIQYQHMDEEQVKCFKEGLEQVYQNFKSHK